jgi:DUF4097 and DUF4098 domain-containing protein YvlB
MMKNRLVLAAVLAAATTGVTFAAVVLPAAQAIPPGTNAWCSGNSYGDDRETYREVREFVLPASGATIAVEAAPNGGIKVEGQARQDVQVQACVSARASTEAEARALAQRVEVTAAADRVSAGGPDGLGHRESWQVSYRLSVPHQTSLSLRTTNGGIAIAHVEGQIDFRTVNGGVSLARLGGEVRGRTTNGGVDIELDGSTWNGGGLDVQTQNGGVKMAVPANYSAQLETGTVNGRLNVDFPVTVQGRIGREVQAQLGSGGPLIKVRTSNGGVSIRQR